MTPFWAQILYLISYVTPGMEHPKPPAGTFPWDMQTKHSILEHFLLWPNFTVFVTKADSFGPAFSLTYIFDKFGHFNNFWLIFWAKIPPGVRSIFNIPAHPCFWNQSVLLFTFIWSFNFSASDL